MRNCKSLAVLSAALLVVGCATTSTGAVVRVIATAQQAV